MNDHYIGISLLFIKREKGSIIGILSSYVLKSKKYEDAIREANEIGIKQNIYNRENKEYTQEYIGIEDVFRVVGPIKEGAMLGRMTIWGQSLQDAKDLLLNPDQMTSITQLSNFTGKWYLSTPVYYVSSSEIEDSRTIACNCLVESIDSSKHIEKSLLIAESNDFKNKILESDYEGLSLDDLFFLGFEDIQAIYGDIENSEPFMMASKRLSTIDEICSMIIDEDDLDGFFSSWND